jgi:MFS family permease
METPLISEIQTPTTGSFRKFLPFWFFLIFYRFAGGLHYALLSPLGARLFPLWLVGVLIGGGALLQTALDVPAGRILDRYGYLKFLKVTTFTFLVAGCCFIFGLTETTYLISLFISVFGWVFFGPGVSAYILSHAPRENVGAFISLRDVFGSLGIVFSSIALIFAVSYSPARIGYTLAALFIVAFIMLFFSPKDHRNIGVETKLPAQHYHLQSRYLPLALRTMKKLNPASTMLILLSLTGGIFYGVVWFVVPLVIAAQAHAGILGIGLGTFDLSIVLLGYILGNIADRFDKRALVFFGLIIFSVSGMVLGFNFGWLFLIFGFIATAGDEMAGISLWSWLYSLDKEHVHDGLISGVVKLFEDFGWAIGPAIAGVLFEFVGPSLAITIGAIPIFIVWIVYQFLMSSHKLQALSPAERAPKKPHRPRHKT